MKGSTKVELIRDGQVHWETTTTAEAPIVKLADTSDLADFSKLRPETANECIYCESTVQLSREHILPYALGGTTTIPAGSCEKCRRITHEFETAVLRGPMQGDGTVPTNWPMLLGSSIIARTKAVLSLSRRN